MTCLLGWNNLVLSGTVIAASPVPGMDGSQLKNDQGSASAAYQTTGVSAAVAIVAPAGSAWGAAGVFRTNLTSAATGTVTVSAAGATVYSWSGGLQVSNGAFVLPLPAGVTGDTLGLAIADPANPDGFINIPLMFAGPTWQPKSNISFASAFGRDSGVTEVVTRGGQEFPVFMWQRRRWNLDFQRIRTAEVWPQLEAMETVARRGRNILFIPDPASAAINDESIFGRLQAQADLGWNFQAADARSWKANITERL